MKNNPEERTANISLLLLRKLHGHVREVTKDLAQPEDDLFYINLAKPVSTEIFQIQ